MNALLDSMVPPPPAAVLPPLVTLPEDDVALRDVVQLVHQRYGIIVPDERRDAFRAALHRMCVDAGLPSLDQLRQRLKRGGGSQLDYQLAEAASVNHTAFFREPDVLRHFESEVVGRLDGKQPVRIWSAASSTGEEAYTLAMMCAQRFGAAVASQVVAILGTDVNQRCVEEATTGIYGAERMRGVAASLQQAYFRPVRGGHQVSASLRGMCLFRRLNLKLRPWPFQSKFDVIFCRNVLYYFDVDQQADIVRRMYRQLKPHGWLFTSVTEGIRDLGAGFRTMSPGIHRKEGL